MFTHSALKKSLLIFSVFTAFSFFNFDAVRADLPRIPRTPPSPPKTPDTPDAPAAAPSLPKGAEPLGPSHSRPASPQEQFLTNEERLLGIAGENLKVSEGQNQIASRLAASEEKSGKGGLTEGDKQTEKENLSRIRQDLEALVKQRSEAEAQYSLIAAERERLAGQVNDPEAKQGLESFFKETGETLRSLAAEEKSLEQRLGAAEKQLVP